MKTLIKLRAACCVALLFSAAAYADSGESADAYRSQGSALHAQGLYAEALAYYGKALMVNPADKLALYESGLTQLKLGSPAAAQVQLERLKKICGQCEETARLAQAILQLN
jgi:tetratricopeptide (TPR) repeat protein